MVRKTYSEHVQRFFSEDNEMTKGIIFNLYGYSIHYNGLVPVFEPGSRLKDFMRVQLILLIIIVHVISGFITIKKMIQINFYASVDICTITLIGLASCVFLLMTHVYRPLFYRFHRHMDTWIDRVRDRDDDGAQVEKDLKRIMQGFFRFFLIGNSFVALLFILKPQVANYDPETLVKMHEAGIATNLPLTLWWPFESSHPIVWLIMSGLNVASVTLIMLLVGTFEGVFNSMASYLEMRLKILEKYIENTDFVAINEERLSPDSTQTKMPGRSMRKIYISSWRDVYVDYVEIVRDFEDFNTMISKHLTYGFMVAAVLFALSLASLLGDTVSLMERISTSLTFFLEMAVFLSFCWHGEEIQQYCLKIRYTVYFANWIKSPRNTRAYITMMQGRTMNSMKVKGFGFRADLETFSKLINTAYSYFNLLLAMKNTGSK